jgi:hypothetical protein
MVVKHSEKIRSSFGFGKPRAGLSAAVLDKMPAVARKAYEAALRADHEPPSPALNTKPPATPPRAPGTPAAAPAPEAKPDSAAVVRGRRIVASNFIAGDHSTFNKTLMSFAMQPAKNRLQKQRDRVSAKSRAELEQVFDRINKPGSRTMGCPNG